MTSESQVAPPERAGQAVRTARRRLARRAGLWIGVVIVGIPFLTVAWGAFEAFASIVVGKPRVMTFGLRRMDAPRIDPRSGLRYRDMGCVVSPTGTLRAQIHNWVTRSAADIGVARTRAACLWEYDAAQEWLAGPAGQTVETPEGVTLADGTRLVVVGDALELVPAGRPRGRSLGYEEVNLDCDTIAVALDPGAEIVLIDVSCTDGQHGWQGDVHSYDVRTAECIQWIRP